jgi:hypothetical protein
MQFSPALGVQANQGVITFLSSPDQFVEITPQLQRQQPAQFRPASMPQGDESQVRSLPEDALNALDYVGGGDCTIVSILHAVSTASSAVVQDLVRQGLRCLCAVRW